MDNMNILSFGAFDIFILVIVLASVVFGLYRGVICSILSFIGWVIALYISFELGPVFAPIYSSITMSEAMSSVLSACVLFLIVAILMALVNSIIAKNIASHLRGLLDRSFGLLFGLVRGFVIVSIIFYLMINALDIKGLENGLEGKDAEYVPDWLKRSETVTLLKKGGELIEKFIPKSFEQELHQSISDSTDETGKVELPSTRAEKIRSMNKLLNSMPQDVIEKSSDADLITLQDMSAHPSEKAKILENLANQYYEYNHNMMLDGSSQKEIERNNKRYHEIMMMIENEILKYHLQARSLDEKK